MNKCIVYEAQISDYNALSLNICTVPVGKRAKVLIFVSLFKKICMGWLRAWHCGVQDEGVCWSFASMHNQTNMQSTAQKSPNPSLEMSTIWTKEHEHFIISLVCWAEWDLWAITQPYIESWWLTTLSSVSINHCASLRQ